MENSIKYYCPWCGRNRTAKQMRSPGVAGRPPAYCRECRDANPEASYCEYHATTHPLHAFDRRGPRHLPSKNCRASNHSIAQLKSGQVKRCRSCLEVKASREFPGRGVSERPTCEECVNRHPGLKMCVDCNQWRPLELFGMSKAKGRPSFSRCPPCHNAKLHGVTVAWILSKQGVDKPQCGSCGSTGKLCVDHDHACCDKPLGCTDCIRGYLCPSCNIAEGHLGTPERAWALAEYMSRNHK